MLGTFMARSPDARGEEMIIHQKGKKYCRITQDHRVLSCFAVALVFFVMLSIGGCGGRGGGSSGGALPNVGTPTGTGRLEVAISWPQGGEGSFRLGGRILARIPATTTTITLSVTGDGLSSPVVRTYPKPAGGTTDDTIELPSGNKTAVARALDSGGVVIADTSTSFSILSGGSTAVDLNLTVQLHQIAFHTNRDGNFEIYVMNEDGTTPSRLTNNPAIDAWPSWSPDGSTLAFDTNRDGNREIYVINADGTGLKNLTNNPAVDGFPPSWSPDGSKIAFVSNRDGNNEIYVMNSDGTNQIRLTNNAADDIYPDWSPDGSKIAFTSYRDGNYEIYVMNADGTNPVRLTNTNPAAEYAPAYSPDGTRIAFMSDFSGNWEVYVMNADGTNRINVTSNPASDYDKPAWSPDGAKIAFTSNRTGDDEIYVMNADGTNVRNITNNPSADEYPSWSR